MKSPRLATPRLDLDPLKVEHADEMVGVLCDPALYGFIGGEPPTLDALRAQYRRLAAGRSANGAEEWHNWTVRRRSDGVAVGTVQATIVSDRAAADVAWMTGLPWQGQGYAAEAARALVDWLRDRGIRTVTAHVHPEHLASAAVARRAGLSATAEIEDGEQVWRWSDRDAPET